MIQGCMVAGFAGKCAPEFSVWTREYVAGRCDSPAEWCTESTAVFGSRWRDRCALAIDAMRGIQFTMFRFALDRKNRCEADATPFRACERCKGSGFKSYGSLDIPSHGCYACERAGMFARPDLQALIDALTVRRKGQTKGVWRKSRPKDRSRNADRAIAIQSRREYYVWRIARFHGGADVCLPMMAELDTAGDPYRPELEALACIMARHVFGSDRVGAHRWGRALGYLQNDVPGLPSAAYEGGPVHDEHKPGCERLERK
jgi:hypothetical protein